MKTSLVPAGRLIRTHSFDAFSSREPESTSLENALDRFTNRIDPHFMGFKSDKLHHRCAEMLDQGGAIDWDDFRFVLAIVRGGSVSAAAKQLGVDHATVIRRVDRLEHHLSAKLFDRRKTGYLLTDAGQRVADSAEAMESTIVANQEAVGGSRAHLTGTVRIGAPDGFGSHFLASRLLRFTERYPDVDLQLVATARLFSLSKREADIAISLSMPKEGRIVGRKLLDYSLGLYAAPAYLDRTPKITARTDLQNHRFVGYIEELLFTPELDYLPQVSPKISAKFRSANLIAQLNATIAGYGIAVLPHFMATAHPELSPVLPEDVRISRTFWLLMHADSKDLARIRAVADYIYETVEDERALFSGC
jgi:DNA-binding transcriptional LysR family regulator